MCEVVHPVRATFSISCNVSIDRERLYNNFVENLHSQAHISPRVIRKAIEEEVKDYFYPSSPESMGTIINFYDTTRQLHLSMQNPERNYTYGFVMDV